VKAVALRLLVKMLDFRNYCLEDSQNLPIAGGMCTNCTARRSRLKWNNELYKEDLVAETDKSKAIPVTGLGGL
jgi:hypothetical protein